MARSKTVWVVTNQAKEPIATFTVKHECVTWLERGGMDEAAWVARFGDGIYSTTIPVWDVKSFLEEANKRK